MAQDLIEEFQKPVHPRSDLSCPSPAVYSPIRPDPPGTPTLVGVVVYFEDILYFRDVDQTLGTDVHVLLRWKDHRLADPNRGDGSADCAVPPGGLWMPAVATDGLRSREQFYDSRFLVDSEGIITLSRRSLLETANSLDFSDFPFDRHRWKFTLWPAFSMADEIIFHPLLVGRSDTLSIQGWKVGRPEAETSIVRRPPRAGTYARFDLFLEMERDWRYYMWKLGFPLTLIVLMAYGVYLLPSSAAAQQIALGMTSMLTLIAYMLALGSGLPKISYLTRADTFFVGSAALVFMGLATAVVALALERAERADLARRMIHAGRVIYPLGISVNVVAAFLW